MEKEKKVTTNNNGSYTIKEKINQTPEDGFVPNSIMEPANKNEYGKYHKGYRTTTSFTTNDPRVPRLFVYSICTLFFAIGIFMFLIHDYIMAIPFILISVLSFFIAKKDIDNISEELKEKDNDVTIDSKEGLENITKEVIDEVKKDFKESNKNTFTKKNYNCFLKTTVPIYCIITLLITLIVAVFVNVIFALVLFFGLTLLGIIFYKVVKKICKY